MNQIQIQLTCPDGTVHSVIEDEEAGEKVCQKCGVVTEEHIISDYGGFVEIERTTTSTHLGLTTVISNRSTDANGQSLSAKDKSSIKNMRLWDTRIRMAANNRDKERSELVSRFCEKLSLSVIVTNDVHKWMTKLSKDKLMRGRERIDFLASTIYYVCKIHDIPKSMSEIGFATNVTSKRMYRSLSILNQTYGSIKKVQSLESYMTQYATKIGMPAKYEPELIRLIKKVTTNQYQLGKTPAVVIGSLIRWISINVGDFEITLEELSKACDTNDVSIRSTLQDMIKVLPLVWVY